MFAIVDIGGFQELVKEGDTLNVPLLEGDKGKKLVFEKVLLISADDALSLGMPFVDGASIEAEVVAHGRGEKIRVYKMRRRKRMRRTKGHRQDYTTIKITGIKTK